MANFFKPFGLRAPLNQGKVTLHSLKFDIPATNPDPIGQSTGLVKDRTAGTVKVAAEGNTLAVDYVVQTILDTEGKPLQILPALTAGTVTAYSVKDQNLFEVQADDSVNATFPNGIEAPFGKFNLTIVAPDTNTGVDQSFINVSSGATGAGDLRMFEMVGFAARTPEVETGFNTIILVRAFNFTP